MNYSNPVQNVVFSTRNIDNFIVDLANEVVKRLHQYNDEAPPNNKPADDLLTVPQAAEFLNLAVPTIYGMISKKTLPFMKKSRKVYFSKKELMEYIKSGRNKSRDEIEADADQYLANKKRLSR